MTFEFEVNNTCLKEFLIAVFDIILHTRGGFAPSGLDANRLFYTDNQYRLLYNPGELNFLIGKRDFLLKNFKIFNLYLYKFAILWYYNIATYILIEINSSLRFAKGVRFDNHTWLIFIYVWCAWQH